MKNHVEQSHAGVSSESSAENGDLGERLSALLDSETNDFETRRMLDELTRSADARARYSDLAAVRTLTQAVLVQASSSNTRKAQDASDGIEDSADASRAGTHAANAWRELAGSGFAARVAAAIDAEPTANAGHGSGAASTRVTSGWMTRVAGGSIAATVAIVSIGVWLQVSQPESSATLAAIDGSVTASSTERALVDAPDLGASDPRSVLANAIDGQRVEGEAIRLFEPGLSPLRTGGAFSLASPFAAPLDRSVGRFVFGDSASSEARPDDSLANDIQDRNNQSE